MGDAILATSLLNTLRHNFPDARIDFVLNDRIAPLFEGHPSISNVITFTEQERLRFFTYVSKVWRTVHAVKYDAIIDMRSTMNTMLFALLSPSSRYRIGRKKWYTWLAFNHRIALKLTEPLSMIDLDVAYAAPLGRERAIEPVREFILAITQSEKAAFGDYLQREGLDLNRPVLLANVTAKLANKVWDEDKMVWVLSRFIGQYPDWQVLFNYAPGAEEQNARRIYEKLGSPRQVLIDIQAHSSRELVALGMFVTCFFGNEGGARHVMQAAGCPSLVICAPGNRKHVWIPQTQVLADGIAPADFASAAELQPLTREEQYALIDKEIVWKKMDEFIKKITKDGKENCASGLGRVE